MTAIAQKLEVSKSTLYSYLPHRGFEIGHNKKPAQTQPGASTGADEAERLPNGDYVLKVPYSSDDDLDKRVHDLFGEISSEVDDRNCFSESNARMDGTDRHWRRVLKSVGCSIAPRTPGPRPRPECQDVGDGTVI